MEESHVAKCRDNSSAIVEQSFKKIKKGYVGGNCTPKGRSWCKGDSKGRLKASQKRLVPGAMPAQHIQQQNTNEITDMPPVAPPAPLIVRAVPVLSIPAILNSLLKAAPALIVRVPLEVLYSIHYHLC